MAKIKLQGHASGTGVLTVTAPNTSTDRTITLPDATGTLATTADITSLAGIDDQSSSNDDQLTIKDTEVVINEDGDDVDFRVESDAKTNALIVDGGTGNIGIGVNPEAWSSNRAALQLGTSSGGTAAFYSSHDAVGMGENFYNNSGDKYINTSHATQYYQSDGSHVWKYAASGSADAAITWTQPLTLHSNGRCSIGDAASGANSSQLDVRNADNEPLIQFLATSTGYTKTMVSLNCNRDTANGTWEIMEGRNGGGRVMFMYDSGNIVNSNNSYGSLSDERIKQDIADASSQWEDIKALKIRKFKLKKSVNKDGAESTPYQIGVVAQEVESAGMSGLVQEGKPSKEDVALHSDFGTVVVGTADNGAVPIKDEEDNITGYEDVFTAGEKVKEVKYSVLYMKAIKALQEAIDRIETLETKVTALENA